MSGINEESRISLVIDGKLANATIKELTKEAKAARIALENMSPDDANRQKLINDFQAVSGRAKELKNEMYGSSQAVNELTNNLGGAAGQTFGLFSQIKQGVSTGVAAFSTLKGAIAATGIGLLVIAIASLYQWFQKTDDGAKALDGIMRAMGNTMNVIFNRLINIGDTIQQLFTNPIEFFKNLGNDIAFAAKEGWELASVFDELEEKQRAMELAASESEKQVAILLRQSQNISKSYAERLAVLKQADAIEMGNMDQKLKYQDELIDAIKRENAEKARTGNLMDEDENKLNQARIERNKMEMESMQLSEKIANRKAQLVEKQREQIAKATEEERKRAKEAEDAIRKEAELHKWLVDFKNTQLNNALKNDDEIGNAQLLAAKKRYYEEGKTAEWLSEQEKQIAIDTAARKLQTVRDFGENELEYEVAVLAAKDSLNKDEEAKLKAKLQKQSDAWFDYYSSTLDLAIQNAQSEDEALDLRIEAIMASATKELAAIGDNEYKRLQIEQETNAKIEAERKASEQRKLDMIVSAADQGLNFANQFNAVLNGVNANQAAKEKNELEQKKRALKDQLDAKKISQETYNAEIEKLEARHNQAQAARDRDAAGRGKILAIADIIFNTATGIMKAVAASPLTGGMPWTALIGALGAAQTGVVLGTQLPQAYDGGFLAPSSSDRTAIPMIGHANEYMVSAALTRDPYTMNAIGVMEAAKAMNTTPSKIIEKQTETIYQNSQPGREDEMLNNILLRLNSTIEGGVNLIFDEEKKVSLQRELDKQKNFEKQFNI